MRIASARSPVQHGTGDRADSTRESAYVASDVDEPVEAAVPALKAIADGVPMRTLGSRSLVGSLVRLELVDRIRVLVFPTIWAATGAEPVFSELPDIDLTLAGTAAIEEKIVLLDYRVPERQRRHGRQAPGHG